MMQTVNIDLGDRAYDIHIGTNMLSHISQYLPQLEERALFIISDQNVAAHTQKIKDGLKNHKNHKNQNVKTLEIPAGEGSKCFAQYQALCEWLLENGVNRNSVLFAVGGGVIGDLVGFAAATTMRGIDFVQVPTTILAQVDSAVGGKTGINTAQGKNLVGAFYQPKAVIADLDTLQSLPKREIRAGYAEIVKYGLINDPEFFAWLENHGADVCALEAASLTQAIATSVKAKANIVAQDECEGGIRALLNLGHTFGHALEAVAGYDGTLLHGEAVAIGMVQAFDFSCKQGLCAPEDAQRVRAHLQKIGLPVKHSLNTTAQALVTRMKRDKKVVSGTMNLVLTRGIGQSFISNTATESQLLEFLS